MKNVARKIVFSPNAQISEEPSQKKSALVKIPILLVSILGTVLEYFEYAIYGFLAPILALHFFSNDDPATALVKAFGIFAVGSLSKPLGALIFGYLGDRQGRRISLRYSMMGISIPTFIVGILPGYESWGWMAPFILVVCRMFQGIFVAGESDGVRIYALEHFGAKNPCLVTSIVGAGAYVGIAFASLVASQIPAHGHMWRLAFLGCSVSGVIVFILRRYLVETPPFLAYQQKGESPLPIKQVIRTHWAPILRTLMICGAGGGAYHFYLVFQGTYLSKLLNMVPHAQGVSYGFWLTAVYVLTLPVAGWAGDFFGLARMGKLAGFLTLGLVAANIGMITYGTISFLLMVLTTISLVFFLAPAFAFFTQQYGIGVRFRCQALGHTVGSMLFSGTTPLVCLFLWQKTQLAYVPYAYFLFLVFMGIVTFIWGDKDKRSLSSDGLLFS